MKFTQIYGQGVSIIIPTYNASRYLKKLLEALNQQTLKYKEVIIIDSSSSDNSVEIARLLGAKVIIIPKHEFDHGGTRTKAGKIANGDILVYLTQDALPYNRYSLENLIRPFSHDKKIGVVFGRQLPYPDATPFAKHLRIFNYPDKSYIRNINDKEKYGLKTCFCSNSFAAYRKSVLEEIDWFKDGLIIGEDYYAVAKILLSGYRVAYVADAIVYHSHNYKILHEFKRYFDIGVFHRNELWLIHIFGKPFSEGIRYFFSEMKFLLHSRCYHLFPEFLIRNILKFIGYKLGFNYYKLPKKIVTRVSMHSNWWNKYLNSR